MAREPSQERIATSGMYELDRIEHALATKRLDHNLFERCATDLLSTVYEGLSPIPQGTDWGRDADIHGTEHPVPPRLLVTTSRSVNGVQANMVKSLRSMKQHNVPVERVVLANPAVLNERQREKLRKKALEFGVTIEGFHDHGFFASRLRRDGEWRQALLGLSGEPITLARSPADLAESPWASLPVIGREQEVEALSRSCGDVILTGNPGTGKTRLAAAVPGVVFVDGDAAEGRLADDLRMATPERVVLDDAAQHLDVLRQLVRLRRAEADLLSYRIVAVCWPDEVDAVKDVLKGADRLDLGLMERTAVDEIIRAMGVAGQLARHEILDQAEGRPGWAISLGDMLTKKPVWSSLLDGRVLFGEVSRYLRRANVGSAAADLLTIVAALGGLSDLEMPKLAASLNLPVPEARRLLEHAAHSGLVDATRTMERGISVRYYQVRPQMLADALVAEKAFRADVPSTNLLTLADEWPEHIDEIAAAAISSARLGATDARPVAKYLVDRLREQDAISLLLLDRYAVLDERAGREVMEWLKQSFARPRDDEWPDRWEAEQLARMAAGLARRYLFPEAVTLLLNASVLGPLPSNPDLGHPVRLLLDLVTEFHPEIQPSRELRHVIASTLDGWISEHADDPSASHVYAKVAAGVLDIHRRSAYLDAADRRQVNMVETVLGADEIKEVYERVWPQIKARLASLPPSVAKAIIHAASSWLRVGGGYDRPFGTEHPAASIKAANRYGRKFIADLKPLVAGQPGLVVNLSREAARFGLRHHVPASTPYRAFFMDVEHGPNWQTAVEAVWSAIKDMAQPWANEAPEAAVARLVYIRDQISLAGITWPRRVERGCEVIAEAAEDLTAWIRTALDQGLFPDAAPFIEIAFRKGASVPADLLSACLANPAARWNALRAILMQESPPDAVTQALAALSSSDFGLLETIAFQSLLSVDRQRQLLTLPAETARGAAAVALFRPVGVGENRDQWPPEEIEAEWLAALHFVDPESMPGLSEDELRSLLEFLAARYPAELLKYLESRLTVAVGGRIPVGRADELALGLRLLDAQGKTAVLSRFGGTNLRWLLLRELPGDDIGWIEQMLEGGLLTPAEVLKSRDGLGGAEPSISDLARLLIPRGVDAAAIASLAQYGVGWGEDSDRFGKLVTDFQEYADSDDPHVATVGRAGLEIYTKARERALREEGEKRIRGLI